MSMSPEEFERGVLLFMLFKSYVPGSQLGTNYAMHWAGFAARHGAEFLEHTGKVLGFPVPAELRDLRFPEAHTGEYVTRHTMLAAARAVLEAPDDTTRATRFIDLTNQIELVFAKWPPDVKSRKYAAA